MPAVLKLVGGVEAEALDHFYECGGRLYGYEFVLNGYGCGAYAKLGEPIDIAAVGSACAFFFDEDLRTAGVDGRGALDVNRGYEEANGG